MERIERNGSNGGSWVYTQECQQAKTEILAHMRLLAGLLFLSAVLPGRVIPDGAPTGDAVPITVTAGGASTQSNVTIAVQ